MADKKISALPAATTPLAGTEVLPLVQGGATDQVSVANLTAGRNFSGLAYTGYSPDGTKQFGFTPGNAVHQILGDYSSGANIPIQIGMYGFPAMLKLETTGDVTLGYNLIQARSAKGINFTANTPAAGMTSQLLNWYEEGTWTPSVGGDATYTIQEGYYVRIGNLVYIQCQLILNTLGTGSTTTIDGLPFTALNPANSSRGTGSVWYCANLATNVTSITPGVTPNGTTITFGGFTAAGASMSVPLTVFQNGTRFDFSMTYRAN